MKPQLPELFRKEQWVLLSQYMRLPDGTDWHDFFEKNASKEFLSYLAKKKKRDAALYSMGIIEN